MLLLPPAAWPALRPPCPPPNIGEAPARPPAASLQGGEKMGIPGYCAGSSLGFSFINIDNLGACVKKTLSTAPGAILF